MSKTEGFGIIGLYQKELELTKKENLKLKENLLEALQYIHKREQFFHGLNSINSFQSPTDELANNVALIELGALKKILNQ